MAFSFASPNRVLDNIKRLELQEAELPSLPSIQPNFDYDSGMDTSRSSVDPGEYKAYEQPSEDDIATPHPNRRAFTPSTATQALPSTSPNMTSTTSASPFPPARTSPTSTESPYIPNRAATSTPHSAYFRSRRFVSDDTRSTARHTQTYTMGHSRNRSDTDDFGGDSTGREKWHTPGEMSRSFSVEGIEAESAASPSLQGGGQLGSERSVPLRDDSYNASSVQAETPLTERLYKSHVILQRPGRRSNLAQSYIFDDGQADREQSQSLSSDAPGSALRVPESDRVPSLSRSEVSATDASEGASTPEGPSRRVTIAPRESSRPIDYLSIEEELPSLPENPTYDYQAETSGTSSSAASYDNTPAPVRHASPYKPQRTNASATPFSQMSTPGMARDPAVGRSEYHDSLVYQGQTPLGALRDVTDHFQAPPTPFAAPFTPSPAGMMSKTSDFSTPRAPLDDAERRKNHVLAVLSSSGIPARDRRSTRGTPHPLRRMSASPQTHSILEEGSPAPFPSIRLNRESTPASRSHLDIDRSASAPPNDSFVSVASSADLTTDRRGTAQPRFSRANISFPTILLPTHNADTSTPGGGSLRGMDNHRADGVKIHKHLNAMNKQLLETNAELAREAEGWRDEVGRLMRLLEEAGVEVEEVDVLANVSRRSGGASQTGDASAQASSSVSMTSEQNAEIVQELAEKLEGLEEILNEKDAQIVELEDEVEALRQGGGGADQRVQELQDQLEEAERTRQNLHSDFAAKTEQHAKRFGEICSGFEEQVQGLEAELGRAKGEVERLRGEKERLEKIADATSAGGREMELGKQVQGLGIELERVKADLAARVKEVENLQGEKESLQQRIEEVEGRLKAAGEDAGGDQEEMQELQDEVARLQEELDHALDRAEEAERMGAELDNLNAVIEEKEAELETLRGKLEVAEMAAKPLRQSITKASPAKSTSFPSPDTVSAEDQASFVAAIEERLDEAYREIGRLKHELSSTPHRKTTIEAKDAKIRALEQEKAALLARVSPNKASGLFQGQTPTSGPAGTPTPAGRPTPFVHKAIASLRMPNTPGSLKELSWLNTTIGDANETIYRAQIGNLHEELNHVNQQLDDNFARLEAAGMGGIELAEKLAAAQQRISDLEDEIRALVHRNKASLALVHAQRKENAQENEERLQAALSAVHKQLDDLRSEASRERKRLQLDNQRMREAKNAAEEQLENEITNMRIDVNEAIDAANSEVEQAKQDAITASTEAASLRKELQASKADLASTGRRLADLQASVEDQQRRHARELSSRVSSTDLADKVAEIERLKSSQRASKGRHDRLSDDLREKTSALARAEERISDLMAERATVLADMEDFERDLNVQKAAARRLTEELRSLNERQAVTDSQKEDYVGLKREYEAVLRQLEGVKEKERAAQDLEAELSRMGREYKAVKGEMRTLERELRLVREERGELDQWKMGHVCESGTTQAMSDQKARFKAQSRDLAAQIQYLKAKYTRESTFRNGLALQKRYLLLLVGGMSLNEQATLKAIASFGFPMPEPPRRKITLKAVGLAVIGLIRARNSAAAWKAEKELKAEAVANFGERRRVSGRS